MIWNVKTMFENFREWFAIRLSGALRSRFSVIADINKKYAKPRIQMTRGVKMALLFLRLYLIFLVLVLGYKFASLALGRG
jgi:hypothetical protein